MKTILGSTVWAILALTIALQAGCSTAGDGEPEPAPTGGAVDGLPASLAVGRVRLSDGAIHRVTYEHTPWGNVFESDIRIDVFEEGDSPDPADLSPTGVGRVDTGFSRWPSGIVPYRFELSSPDLLARTQVAMQHIAARSDIRFTRDTELHGRTSYTGPGGSPQTVYDYVLFRQIDNPSICGNSLVGRAGGSQAINLDATCDVGGIVHEIGHAIGLWHEQSRADRNGFLAVDLGAALPNFRYNFDQHLADGFDIGSYDYCSVMHYHRFAFSAAGLPTLVPLAPVACTVVGTEGALHFESDIGQRYGLSDGDRAALATLNPGLPTGRPVADAGGDKILPGFGTGGTLTFNVTLDGSKSYDPGGQIVAYSWSTTRNGPPLGTGPQFQATVTLSVYAPSVTKAFFLTVKDNLGRTHTDRATVTINRYQFS
jgi:hypothetical protein